MVPPHMQRAAQDTLLALFSPQASSEERRQGNTNISHVVCQLSGSRFFA